MINEKMIQELKQTNISADAQKTKERISVLWRAAGKTSQEEILTLAGLKRSSVQRVYKSGSISAKVALAFAQVLDVDPCYLTGQADVRGSCDPDTIMAFLKGLGYTKQLAQVEKEARRLARAEKKATREAETEAAQCPQSDEADMTPAAPAAPELSDEDMVVLLRAVLLKARADDKYAQVAGQLRQLLLS